MVCDSCGHKQATVHLTEIVNDQTKELHLCEECAREKGALMGQQFGLTDLLASLVGIESEPITKGEKGAKCPNCKMTYNDFRKYGRLGCGDCYVAFKDSLTPLLKKIHGSNQHVGKVPSGGVKTTVKARTELQELQMRLQKAIEMEEFEEAARIRDEIKKDEKKLKGK